MEKQLMQEALSRQGTTFVASNGHKYRIPGTTSRVLFRKGGEGLVQFAIDETSRVECCIKCFWDPSTERRQKSELLVRQKLANRTKLVADALAGAPYDIIKNVGAYSPFAILMKKVRGDSWADLKEKAKASSSYPPTNWPPLTIRATWAYGLATAVTNLEKNHFVHADLSEGNVMLVSAEPTAGDMALVDFDAFVHAQHPEFKILIRGSEGYAAEEIWRKQTVGIGSDRVALAILIQEFLMIGDPAVGRDDAFTWIYGQENELCRHGGEPHPHVVKKYPEVAKLVREAIKAVRPADRPAPEKWREVLRVIVTGQPPRKKLSGMVVKGVPPGPTDQIVFGDTATSLDLARTKFRIRATIERNRDGSVDVVVGSGGQVNAKDAASGARWRRFDGPARIPVHPGTVMFDLAGSCRVLIDGNES